MSNSYDCPSADVKTGHFPDFHSHAKPSWMHLFPSDRMFGQPFIINASAVAEALSGTFNFFDAATSPLAVLRRIGVSIYLTFFLSFFVTHPWPAMPMHDPLSTTHRRLPVATSPDSEEPEACVAIGVLEPASGTPFGATCCTSSFPFFCCAQTIANVVRASAVVIQTFVFGTGLRLSLSAYGRISSSISTWTKPISLLNNTFFIVTWTVMAFRTT